MDKDEIFEKKIKNLKALNDVISILLCDFHIIRKPKSIVNFSVREKNSNDFKRINWPWTQGAFLHKGMAGLQGENRAIAEV